jgi:hypothetical protein
MATRFPLKDVASKAASLWTTVGALATALAAIGIITTDQNTALQVVYGAIGTIVAGVTSALAAFKVRKDGEPLVTPLADPRNDQGDRLVVSGDVIQPRQGPTGV